MFRHIPQLLGCTLFGYFTMSLESIINGLAGLQARTNIQLQYGHYILSSLRVLQSVIHAVFVFELVFFIVTYTFDLTLDYLLSQQDVPLYEISDDDSDLSDFGSDYTDLTDADGDYDAIVAIDMATVPTVVVLVDSDDEEDELELLLFYDCDEIAIEDGPMSERYVTITSRDPGFLDDSDAENGAGEIMFLGEVYSVE